MRAARATRRPPRCVRILTPGSSAPRPGKASAAIAERFGAAPHRRSAATWSRARARGPSPPRCRRKRPARLRAGQRAASSRSRRSRTTRSPAPPNDWRKKVAAPALTPPPVTPESPLIALVDAAADLTHPEWTGDPNFATLPGHAGDQLARHGDRCRWPPRRRTGSASSASGRARGRSTSRSRPCPGTDGEITCAASGDAIAKAVADRRRR